MNASSADRYMITIAGRLAIGERIEMWQIVPRPKRAPRRGRFYIVAPKSEASA